MTAAAHPISAPAVVVGGGIGGLTAAYAFAREGVAPLLLESRGTCGGLVFGAPVGGVWVDLGADSFAKRSRPVADLCAELGLELIDPSGRSWIWSHRRPSAGAEPGFAFPIPHGVLGIPTSLDDPVLEQVLSPAGLARAREDLTMPAEVGADCADLGSLVETRLGREVLDRLVDPVAGGVHSSHPSTLAVDVVSPGLRDLLAREGSLVRAAAAQRAAAPQGAIVASVPGGMFRLARALATRITELGGTLATRRIVTSIARDGDRWLVTHEAAGRAAHPADPPVPAGDPVVVSTSRLVVALDGRAALDLLGRVPALEIDDWTLPRGADLAQVCLAVDHPALDAGPRGSGLLVTRETEGEEPQVAAKALTHYSVKWPWVVADQPVHILRVSYGRAGVPTPEPTLEVAVADAATLLGVPLTPDRVVAHTVVHFANSLPPQTPAHRARAAQAQEVLDRLGGIAVTGAWFAGTGLAAVIPHAERAARKLAHA